GLPEEPQAHWLSRDAAPLLRREVHGAVDVDIAYAKAADVDEVGCDRVDRPTRVRLELNRDLEAPSLRGAHHGRQAQVLLGAAAPPGADDLVDARLCDVPHLSAEHARVSAR